jgi:Co/Zn/Cd efflux system component
VNATSLRTAVCIVALLNLSYFCVEFAVAMAIGSARNDAWANIAIIAAGLLTAATLSAWPDLVVGLGIALMNGDAAREVWQAARQERQVAQA